MAKTNVKTHPRGKSTKTFFGAWGQKQGSMTGKTSEATQRAGGQNTRPSMSRKWDLKRSTTGQGNPRQGKNGKVFTGGGF
jgi:hypothetical protein